MLVFFFMYTVYTTVHSTELSRTRIDNRVYAYYNIQQPVGLAHNFIQHVKRWNLIVPPTDQNASMKPVFLDTIRWFFSSSKRQSSHNGTSKYDAIQSWLKWNLPWFIDTRNQSI